MGHPELPLAVGVGPEVAVVLLQASTLGTLTAFLPSTVILFFTFVIFRPPYRHPSFDFAPLLA